MSHRKGIKVKGSLIRAVRKARPEIRRRWKSPRKRGGK